MSDKEDILSKDCEKKLMLNYKALGLNYKGLGLLTLSAQLFFQMLLKILLFEF